MALRLKNSDIAKIFGVTSVGSFANNEAIKNNPQIIQLLLAKQERRKAYKSKKQLRFERNYYQKLLMRSEQIKADRAKGLEKINTLGKTKSELLKISTAQSKELLESNVTRDTKQKIHNNDSTTTTETLATSSVGDLKKTKDVKENYNDAYLESESKGRYYHISIARNLFGEYSLIRSWGSLSGRLGNYKIVFYDTLEMAQQTLKAMTKQIVARGYKVLGNK